jgi:hypothetical protein
MSEKKFVKLVAFEAKKLEGFSAEPPRIRVSSIPQANTMSVQPNQVARPSASQKNG